VSWAVLSKSSIWCKKGFSQHEKKKFERIFVEKKTCQPKRKSIQYPIILASVQFTEQSIRGKDCSAGDAGQENRFLTDYEHSVPTLFGITCGTNNVIDNITKAMRNKNLEEFPDDATLNKYMGPNVYG
jgi:hypothetical protein